MAIARAFTLVGLPAMARAAADVAALPVAAPPATVVAAVLAAAVTDAAGNWAGASSTAKPRRSSPNAVPPDVTFARATYEPGGSTRRSATACARIVRALAPGVIAAVVVTSAGPSGVVPISNTTSVSTGRSCSPSRSICSASRSSCRTPSTVRRDGAVGSPGTRTSRGPLAVSEPTGTRRASTR